MTGVRESSGEHANHADLRRHLYCRLSIRFNGTGLRHVVSSGHKTKFGGDGNPCTVSPNKGKVSG